LIVFGIQNWLSRGAGIDLGDYVPPQVAGDYVPPVKDCIDLDDYVPSQIAGDYVPPVKIKNRNFKPILNICQCGRPLIQETGASEVRWTEGYIT
jgi:hypothetical protein